MVAANLVKCGILPKLRKTLLFFLYLIRCCKARYSGTPQLATYQELSNFLAEVERRAYKQALFAVHDEHGALDIVQDAMMKLAEKYSGKPVEEFPMLFQRILQNTIRDHYRRQKVRSLWTTLLSSLIPHQEEEYDPLETLEVADDSNKSNRPARPWNACKSLN